MSFKRSVLLAVGVALAASLISNAASPMSAVSSDKPEKPACSDTNGVSAKSPSSLVSTVSSEESEKLTCKDMDQTQPTSDASLAPPASPTSPASKMPAVNTHDAAEMNSATQTPKSATLPRPIQAPSSALDHDHDKGKHDQPNTVITPAGLAMADTVLSYCAEIDRNSGDTYEAGIKMIIQGHSESEISSVRKTAEYAKTRDTINTQLSRVSYGTGLSACQQFSGATHRPNGVASPIHTRQFGSY